MRLTNTSSMIPDNTGVSDYPKQSTTFIYSLSNSLRQGQDETKTKTHATTDQKVTNQSPNTEFFTCTWGGWLLTTLAPMVERWSSYEVRIARICCTAALSQHTNNARKSCTPWCLCPLLSLCYPPYYQNLFTLHRRAREEGYCSARLL
jgi:hypothetical protein